ncbi:MAG: ferredoxin:glutaredoxin reductase [bacterium]|nr:MAG: ferredoxin:glutaredoxin reductase [bacterium]
MEEPSSRRVEEAYRELIENASAGGYHLNPDRPFTMELVRSLLVNQERYGYMACPCRLADGQRERDLDIICPCDYRDPDLAEFGSCYCALYVSADIAEGRGQAGPIPERRPPEGQKRAGRENTDHPASSGLAYPVWRCRVCGYLCARHTPPETCPICHAEGDRFDRFM